MTAAFSIPWTRAISARRGPVGRLPTGKAGLSSAKRTPRPAGKALLSGRTEGYGLNARGTLMGPARKECTAAPHIWFM